VKRISSFIAAALLGTVAVPALAAAQNAVTSVDLNMRAGPATSFPVVAVIPEDAPVTVHGCIAGYGWCDTSFQGARGWVNGDYLRYFYRERYVPVVEYGPRIGLPIISFSVDSYWDRYYRTRPWYRERARWREVWIDRRRDRDNRAERREERLERRLDRREERVERKLDGMRERRGQQAERRRDQRDFSDDGGNRRESREVRSERNFEGRGGRAGWGQGGGIERGPRGMERGGGGMNRGGGPRRDN
jgi:uncharacterized protein YraI